MAKRKVLRVQPATKTLFETADALAAAHRFHTGRLPHGIANRVDLAAVIDG
jgi:hypothetical protein